MIIRTFITSGNYIYGRSRSLHTQGALGYTEKLACRIHFVSCGLIEETVVYCFILVLDDYETRLPAEVNKGKRKRTVGGKMEIGSNQSFNRQVELAMKDSPGTYFCVSCGGSLRLRGFTYAKYKLGNTAVGADAILALYH